MSDLFWTNARRKVRDCIPWEFNPRQLTEKEAKHLTESLKKFNLVEPPALNTDGKLVGGHQRLKIMAMLGRGDEEIDVRVPNRMLTEQELKELNVRLNKNTGSWDFDALANYFDAEDLVEWGFDEKELGGAGGIVPDAAEDKVPDTAKVRVVTVPGDLFEIKTANDLTLRLKCGSPLDGKTIEAALGSKKAEIAVVDPLKDEWDARDKPLAEDFIQGMIKAMSVALRDGGMLYVLMPAPSEGRLRTALEKEFTWGATIIWNHDRDIASRREFAAKHTPIWYGWKRGAEAIRSNSDRSKNDVWDFDIPEAEGKNQKPVGLVEQMLTLSSDAADTCVDLFNESGTTGLACIKAGRNFIGIESSPKNVDITLRRWNDWMKEHNINYSITRNGQNFSVPELFAAVGDTKTGSAQN